MFRWIKRMTDRRARSKRSANVDKCSRPMLEALEDRIAPATSLAPPTILDPAAAIRVDQDSYTIRGTLQQPAKNGATILAYLDSNRNGAYDVGVDALAASAAVAKGTSSFEVPVNLPQDAIDQFFLIAADGK